MAVTKKHLAGIPRMPYVKRPASDTSCSVGGCVKPRVKGKGMCRMHRARIIRSGSPGEPESRTGRPIAERIAAMSERVPSGCLIFTGTIGNTGYGRLGVWADGRRRTVYAHRASYEAQFGEIPPGLEILHSCDTPTCVEPSHLTVGSRRDNALDMVSKRRHPLHLAPGVVAEMDARSDRGESIATISRAMGIPQGTIAARRTRRKRAAA